MKKDKLVAYGFVHSVGVFVYVSLVAFLMNSGEHFFGQVSDVLAGAMILLLFVLSATIVGTLVLGRPILWYLDGVKKEALKLFFYTIAWLFLWLILGFSILGLLSFYA